jgi:hypothetical protein
METAEQKNECVHARWTISRKKERELKENE